MAPYEESKMAEIDFGEKGKEYISEAHKRMISGLDKIEYTGDGIGNKDDDSERAHIKRWADPDNIRADRSM
jgi:hypothetical protein